MFQGLLKRAERSIDQVVAKFLGRAMVAVPLLVAGGFATAALAVKLVEQYGPVTGYGLMAVLFGVIGLVTMAIVGVGTRSEGEPAAASETSPAPDDAATQREDMTDATDLLTPELRSLLASAAPVAIPGLVRGVGRNLPLVFMLALLAFVISRFAESSGIVQTAGDDGSANAADAPEAAPAAAA